MASTPRLRSEDRVASNLAHFDKIILKYEKDFDEKTLMLDLSNHYLLYFLN
jgi:hypothetical protein